MCEGVWGDIKSLCQVLAFLSPPGGDWDILDSRLCPIGTSFSVTSLTNELFPTPVMPITAISIGASILTDGLRRIVKSYLVSEKVGM